jgi:hypothetical protein
MRGCVLQGKVVFEDGVVPSPRWPSAPERDGADPASAGLSGRKT